jgi:UDP:flavonoid glycosyltransferase YjiC (YdhE family)
MPLRVLALPYGHALSHVSRPLRLAEELRQRGHEVVFAGGGKELKWAEKKGFGVVQTEELPHEVLFGRIRARRLRFIEEDELARLVEADLAVFAEVKPDLVLTDGRISARLSTRRAELKHAALVNVSSTRHRAIPYVPLFEWVRPGWLRAPFRRFNLWFEMAVFDRAVPAFRKVAHRLGIPSTVTATDCLEGNDLTLLPDLPEFMPSRGLPPSHHYIGPLTFRADLPDPPWWSELLRLKAEGRKVVYFTLGTTGTRELFDEVLPALGAQADWAAVVTTGGQLDPALPASNVFVAPYLDGDRVMEIADLVVCHGGNGTIYQALAHGVPIVGMPTIPDQEYNMRCAEVAQIGKRLHWEFKIMQFQSLRNKVCGWGPFRRMQELESPNGNVAQAVNHIEAIVRPAISASDLAPCRACT